MKGKLLMIQLQLPVDGIFQWKKVNKKEIMEKFHNEDSHHIYISYYFFESENHPEIGPEMRLWGTKKEMSCIVDEAENRGYDIYILDREKC